MGYSDQPAVGCEIERYQTKIEGQAGISWVVIASLVEAAEQSVLPAWMRGLLASAQPPRALTVKS